MAAPSRHRQRTGLWLFPFGMLVIRSIFQPAVRSARTFRAAGARVRGVRNVRAPGPPAQTTSGGPAAATGDELAIGGRQLHPAVAQREGCPCRGKARDLVRGRQLAALQSSDEHVLRAVVSDGKEIFRGRFHRRFEGDRQLTVPAKSLHLTPLNGAALRAPTYCSMPATFCQRMVQEYVVSSARYSKLTTCRSQMASTLPALPHATAGAAPRHREAMTNRAFIGTSATGP